jgi:hypothetical protein
MVRFDAGRVGNDALRLASIGLQVVGTDELGACRRTRHSFLECAPVLLNPHVSRRRVHKPALVEQVAQARGGIENRPRLLRHHPASHRLGDLRRRENVKRET